MISKKQLEKIRVEEAKNMKLAEDFAMQIYFRGRKEMIEEILKVYYDWEIA